jgi:hypothetical protein
MNTAGALIKRLSFRFAVVLAPALFLVNHLG